MSPSSNEKTIFSWLHLSDIHFSHGNEHHQIDQELVLQSLINDVKKTINTSTRQIPHPDAILVTGDIAFSGAVKDSTEYEKAEIWLDNIAKEVSLGRKQIFVIPGNHDIQRNIYNNDDDAAMLIDLLRDGKRLLEWAMKKEKQNEILLKRIGNYLNFASKFAPQCLGDQYISGKLYWQWNTTPISGMSIRIIGLNTSLLCQNDDDQNKLRLSLDPLKNIPDIAETSPYIAIGLGHHPLDWLADRNEIETWLRKKIHVYLCGHVHNPDSSSYHLGGGAELITIQAGAVHNDDYPGATPDSYNYGAVIQKSNGSFVLRVWNRIWSEKFKDFRDDSDFHPVDQPYAEFDLKANLAPIRLSERGGNHHKSFGPFWPLGGFNRKARFVSDSPPVVDVWVGRENELSIINQLKSRVIAITGIGGQGKSAFASKFLDDWTAKHPTSFWDWRDCREQRERFHSQLVAIIEHWTDGNVSGEALEGAETKDLVTYFFDIVENQSGLIILDNVDHYIDVENREFTLGVSDFVKMALSRSHSLTILLTSRPRVNYASLKFQEIHLEGISEQETFELFALREVDINENVESIKKIHELTDGHPFWLNVIATQIARQPSRCEQIIIDLEEGEIDSRAKILMETTWKQLDSKQKTILRYMTELTSPEDIDWLYDCVKISKEFKTRSNFNHVFFNLQALNLIVETKGKYSKQKEYDLHPIIKNFIVSEFRGRGERKPYQDGVLWVINTYINKLGGEISIATPFSDLEYYIKKSEVSLRKYEIEEAMKSLLRIADMLVHRGIPGELFRVGEDVFDAIIRENDYKKYIDQDNFHKLNSLLGRTYAEYGRKIEAVKQVERYSRLVSRGTAQYVSVCSVACYVFWMIEDYNSAIKWGKEGVRLKIEEHIDTKYDSSYNLALAQRDSGDVQMALDYFTAGESLDDILNLVTNNDFSEPARLGNIGRCLQFQGEYDNALQFIILAARLLEKEENHIGLLNRGYAALWIGEIFEKKNDYKSAYLAYRHAEIIWLKQAPLRASKPKDLANTMLSKTNDLTVLDLTDLGIERMYKKLLGI